MNSLMDYSPLIMLLLATSFGMWAGVVAFFAHAFRSDLQKMSKENTAALRDIAHKHEKESEKLNEYILQTEQRLILLENTE